MRKELLLEIVLGIIIVSVAAIYFIFPYVIKQSKKREVSYHTYYTTGDLRREYLSEIKEGAPKQYEVEIAGTKYKGDLLDMYYSREYAKYVCRYLCASGDSIHCIYDDETTFLSMTFSNPILLFEDVTEEKMKKELELYVGKKNDYEFQKIAMDDKVCYGYVKKVSGVETAEGVRVVIDSMGKVHEINKYKLDEEIESINQEEVDEAYNELLSAVANRYGATFDVVEQQFIKLDTSGNAVNYTLKVKGITNYVKYQVIWQHIKVESCDCES